jgi:hypothetical protein
MKPKEKAFELFEKYDNYPLTYEWKKQCALIAVNEIINCDIYFKTLEDAKPFIAFWYEVQEEIQKL